MNDMSKGGVKVCHPYGTELSIGATSIHRALLEELNYWKVSISDLNSLGISVWEKRLQRLIWDALFGFQ